MAETDELEKEFNDWWSTDGQYLDPDTSDVPWFDKRRGLAEYAFRAARCLDGWNDDMSAAKRDGTHYLIRLEGSSPPTVAHWFEDDPKLGGTGNPGWYLSVSQFAGPPVHPVAWQHISTRRPAPAGAEVGVADRERALSLLAAEDARQNKLHDLLEAIREKIRTGVAPEHRPEGLFTDIQNAVYAMRRRTRLLDDAAITGPLVSPPVEPQGEAVAGMAQTEGACLRIEMVASTLPKGSPGGGVLREAVSTIRHYAAPPVEPQGRKLAHDLTPDQADKLAFVVHYSAITCAPENIAAAVKEIDCGPACEHVSLSGSTCYRFERGDYCPNLVAETLREIGAALYGPRAPQHYTPRERLGGAPLDPNPKGLPE